MYIKNPLMSKKMKTNVVVILFPVCTVLNTVCVHIYGTVGPVYPDPKDPEHSVYQTTLVSTQV